MEKKMIVKHEYPILEYSTEKTAVINPDRSASKADRSGEGGGGFRRFPRLCLVTFFEEVLDSAVERYGGEKIGTYVSEMTIQYITGLEPLDTFESKYLETLKSMNVERAIEMRQEALDDFNAR